jgi:two-component system chemotaxis sensor kinase CheA
VELIRVEAGASGIEYLHDVPVYRLRGSLLPVVYLNAELGLEARVASSVNIVVLQAEQRRFGLVVDHINDTREIVVKPLTDVLKSIPVFAGSTILGDGRVALILDTVGLAQRARVVTQNREPGTNAQLLGGPARAEARQSLLVVRSPGNGRLAIPLSGVARLEEFAKDLVEGAGSVDVVQYRGQILPLVYLREILTERRNHARVWEAESEVGNGPTETLQVVVFGQDGNSIGLVVDEILDVLDAVIRIKGKASRGGISHTAVIQNQVTELFDVDGFLAQTLHLLVSSEAA